MPPPLTSSAPCTHPCLAVFRVPAVEGVLTKQLGWGGLDLLTISEEAGDVRDQIKSDFQAAP
jgi:hypothetical protein